MEPSDYLRLFRRRWWIIVGVALAGAAFAWITTPGASAPPVRRFEATHTLIVEPEARAFTPENPETIALLASSGAVPTRVSARLEMAGSGELLGRTTITGNSKLGVIEIKATTQRADRSELIANVFAEELIGFLDEQEQGARQRDIDRARQQAEELEQKVNETSDRIAAGDGDPALLEQQRLVFVSQYGEAETRYQQLIAEPLADAGLASLGPAIAVEVDAGVQAPRGRTERALILATIGSLLALVLVTLLERLDVRIKTKEDAEAAFRLPVIAEVPQIPYSLRRARNVISHAQPASTVAEAYRGLRTTLLVLRSAVIGTGATHDPLPSRRAEDRPRIRDDAEADAQRVYIVTSSRPSEGKTTTTVNLAAVFAEAGRSVLVIGADVRRPEVHQYLDVQRSPGLTELLSSRVGVEALSSYVVPTSIPGVSLVPGGSHVSNPGELLLDGPELLRAARQLADVVLVDTTPMLTVNDAIQLMSGADSVIVTCRAGRGTKEAARRVQEALARLHVPVAGVVLVGAHAAPGVASYYYGGYESSLRTGPIAALLRRLRLGGNENRDGADVTQPPRRQEAPLAVYAPTPEPPPVEPVAERRRETVPEAPVPAPARPAPPAPVPERSVESPERDARGSAPAPAPNRSSARDAPASAGEGRAGDADAWSWP